MIIEFIGADHEVTGSCHYVECGDTRFLVDYGMEQGVNVFANAELPVPPADLDYVLVTHAHIDHSGLLPLLFKQGFHGTILATHATAGLCRIMLEDSAHIQEQEAEWRNRKAMRAGEPGVEPIFTMQDAEETLKLLKSVGYGETVELTDNVSVRFIDAGHLLGSASIEVWLKEDGIEKKIVFSGDIGNLNHPLIRDPQYIDSADYVLTEATYGDRFHPEGVDHVEELREVIQDTFDRGGNVVIPAFAVGRTQELLYYIRIIKKEQMIKGHEGFEVWVDSPLAIEATEVFKANLLDCFDDETRELIDQGENPVSFDGLKTALTTDESVAINSMTTPKVIISAAGMCDAGRIRHHLKHNLWRPESTVVFAGYQSTGTLGRTLQDGAEKVKIFGETIEVKARIATLQGISGHADQTGLLRWIGAFSAKKPDQVFIVHGEDSVCLNYAKKVAEEYGLNVAAPFSGSVYDLAKGEWVKLTEGVPIDKDAAKAQRNDSVYVQLKTAADRLMKLVDGSSENANADIRKLTEQIQTLCDKWGG